MKILVVDDEALLVKGIRFNLQNEGYEVITGSDGLDAVRLVQEQSPDLVVLDVMMPNMDGLTACGKIREFSDIPIIMLTAKTDDMDKLMGFDHGADDYMTKPFNILELKARIRALLRRAHSVEKKAAPGNTLTIGTDGFYMADSYQIFVIDASANTVDTYASATSFKAHNATIAPTSVTAVMGDDAYTALYIVVA